MRLFLRWLVVVAAVGPSWATITIDLYCDGSKTNCSLNSYDDEDVFTSRYANIPGNTISGHVMEPAPNNACLYITPLPGSLKVNDSKWFALVDHYPDCPEQMIHNVRNAGFDLIIAYRSNYSSIHGLSTSVENMGFPIVVISEDYAHYLLDNALFKPTNPITARIEVSNLDFVIVIFAFLAGSACLFFPCLSLVAYCVKKSRQRGAYAVNPTRHTIPIRDHHAQARLARQELIESILRQLQELQGEARQHIPLGEEETKALPLRPFIEMKRESRGKETCAICVDEFQEGDMTRVLPCEHYFHPDCIDPWLSSHSSLCPLCKRSVPRRNEQPAAGGARPPLRGFMQIPVLLETSSEDDSSTSSLEFGSARSLQSLNGVAEVLPPQQPQPPQPADEGNRDSISVGSDSPLMEHDRENANTT